MTPRNVYTGLFIALCLTLSGLILGRQMAAHPVLPDAATGGGNADGRNDGERFPNRQDWHIAAPATRRAVLGPIQGQLDALRRGDADRSVSYQSREMRRQFARPGDFLKTVVAVYPEFGHSKSASFDPVWTDAGERHAGVQVRVIGQNGRQALGFYRMVREGGVYRVGGVRMGL